MLTKIKFSVKESEIFFDKNLFNVFDPKMEMKVDIYFDKAITFLRPSFHLLVSYLVVFKVNY